MKEIHKCFWFLGYHMSLTDTELRRDRKGDYKGKMQLSAGAQIQSQFNCMASLSLFSRKLAHMYTATVYWIFTLFIIGWENSYYFPVLLMEEQTQILDRLQIAYMTRITRKQHFLHVIASETHTQASSVKQSNSAEHINGKHIADFSLYVWEITSLNRM